LAGDWTRLDQNEFSLMNEHGNWCTNNEYFRVQGLVTKIHDLEWMNVFYNQINIKLNSHSWFFLNP
jgi:hypothetical protein